LYFSFKNGYEYLPLKTVPTSTAPSVAALNGSSLRIEFLLDQNQRLQAEQEVAQLQRQLQQSNQMSAAQLASVQSQLSDMQQQVTATNMAKADMERELEQMKAREVERNTLTESPVNIQDSAVAGDSLIGSTKIENQTVNDADAIARAAAAAAIDAYRMGLDDRER